MRTVTSMRQENLAGRGLFSRNWKRVIPRDHV